MVKDLRVEGRPVDVPYFEDVSAAQAVSGLDTIRRVVVNNAGDETVTGVTANITRDTPSPDSHMEIGVGVSEGDAIYHGVGSMIRTATYTGVTTGTAVPRITGFGGNLVMDQVFAYVHIPGRNQSIERINVFNGLVYDRTSVNSISDLSVSTDTVLLGTL